MRFLLICEGPSGKRLANGVRIEYNFSDTRLRTDGKLRKHNSYMWPLTEFQFEKVLRNEFDWLKGWFFLVGVMLSHTHLMSWFTKELQDSHCLEIRQICCALLWQRRLAALPFRRNSNDLGSGWANHNHLFNMGVVYIMTDRSASQDKCLTNHCSDCL